MNRSALLAAALLLLSQGGEAVAQSIEMRQWQGTAAMTRQPEQVVANNDVEWRSLWSRVGTRAPDIFEPGRTSAVGIFLGTRTGGDYAVNVLSTTRRRDRIMVVFEERGPPEPMMAQRPMGVTRPVSGGTTSMAFQSSPTIAPSSGSIASLPSAANRAVKPPTSSPWAIVLIRRADLPVSVEQRLFR